MVKDTKFESKSQLNESGLSNGANCFYWSKIQNLKANHNVNGYSVFRTCIAFIGQRYKIWKQITTRMRRSPRKQKLLLLVKDTKFESKSQPDLRSQALYNYCFYWSKIQNLKANHNISSNWTLTVPIAFIGQRYKIWKQITTQDIYKQCRQSLLLLVKDTKFESKSQPLNGSKRIKSNCFYWSKIQNLKANHNSGALELRKREIAFIGQRYKIWKQITTAERAKLIVKTLLLLVKDTKFESKSQH